MSESRAARVAKAVKSIRTLYSIGKKIPAKKASKDTYGQGDLAAAAAKVGLTPEVARMARQFADPVSGYSAADVEDLCRDLETIQRAQSDDLAILGRTHVLRLVTVPPKKRKQLQEKAIRNGWTLSELEGEIRTRYGTRREGGRSRRGAKDAVGLLVQLEGMCESWRRMMQVIDVGNDNQQLNHATLDSLPLSLRRHVHSVVKAARLLQDAISDELLSRQPERMVRLPFRNDETASKH